MDKTSRRMYLGLDLSTRQGIGMVLSRYGIPGHTNSFSMDTGKTRYTIDYSTGIDKVSQIISIKQIKK